MWVWGVVDGQRSYGTIDFSLTRGLGLRVSRLGNEMSDVQQRVVLFLIHIRRMGQDSTHGTLRSIGISWLESWLDGSSNSFVARGRHAAGTEWLGMCTFRGESCTFCFGMTRGVADAPPLIIDQDEYLHARNRS